MVKIKVKKKMTLPELIQWGWDNKNKNREFYSENGKKVIFNSNGNFKPKVYFKPEDTFTVEVEEEITEETEIHSLVEVYRASSGVLKLARLLRTNIKDANTDETVAFYMLNDDMTMTLLWKEGEMVE
ncbi:hypothetical protein [Staphylococcus chromogenes]|uniref:hypothetical protein n=1 Tax=Staphylococcus chromogenes TaxID=46126 RepID=UPI001E364877|nr:hypothetical protein [Staphylococcus chromogenes]MCD9070638.1 hypothetical protein [Staphylococcus chromogenes]